MQPLETLQYVGYSDEKKAKARMISCKLHSAEQIRAAYGATAAGESTTSARLNRRTLGPKARATLEPGDTVTIRTPGGGGYGRPP